MSDKPSTTPIDADLIRALPKVQLHDHLDGSLRPTTVIELAKESGYEDLPTSEPDELSEWFFRGASRGNLPEYLEGFRHTIALMQTPEALERVAYEAMEDMSEDGVVYNEVRFAPHFHTTKGLGLDAVMGAVIRGLDRGAKDFDIDYGLLVCALRNQSEELALKLAEVAIAWRERGCVGFDLAGEEDGHPAKHHLEAFQYMKRMNGSITIHAGESFGPESIWQALQYCGAHRIGHGTRLIEDIAVYDKKVIHVGTLARYMLDHRIPIEACLSSNVHTGAATSLEDHPFPYFLEHGYRVTLNTDNRLMSRTTMTREYQLAVETYGCDLGDLERISLNGIRAAFAPYAKRNRILQERILPAFAKLR
ncbi:MAG: adenosine deaminase [Planctomycetota bacterium]|jgi:adenosine deaminase